MFMKADRREFATEAMCRVLGVASSGYYEWPQRPRSDRAIENERLLRLSRASFTVTWANVAWVTDTLYLPTWQGWLCLAVVLDLFSRKLVGWAVAPTIYRELVLDGVVVAVRQLHPRGTLIHSD